MRILFIGLGYVGMPLACRLSSQGHAVSGLKRTHSHPESLVARGIRPLTADVTNLESLRAIKPEFEVVLNLVSSSKGGPEDYERVYKQGTINIRKWLEAGSLQKYIHAGSTSVYGQSDGGLVTEDSPRQPTGATSQILAQTEDYLIAGQNQFPALIARLAGIYGPGRGHLFQQYLSGEARLDGDGLRYLNMIHQEDAVRAFVAAIDRGNPGDCVNVVDDEPVTQKHFFEWLSQTLGRAMPASREAAESVPRKRGNTSKRISNRRLRENWQVELSFPTYREGYASEIARMAALGQIEGAGKSSQ